MDKYDIEHFYYSLKQDIENNKLLFLISPALFLSSFVFEIKLLIIIFESLPLSRTVCMENSIILMMIAIIDSMVAIIVAIITK